MKKYTIHILGIKAINEETFDLPQEQNAIIVCSERVNRHIYQCLPENILILDFPDINDKNGVGAFNGTHAKKIIDFLHGLSDKVIDVYVCCSMGYSRSPAIAAAILRMSGRSDLPVWKNPYYQPNTLVYFTLCREYGIFETKLSVRVRSLINRRAFKLTKKGKPTKYERWQILE